MSALPLRLVIIDDDPIFRLGLSTALTDREFRDVQVIAQGEISSLEGILAENTPDLLLLVLDKNPLDFCAKLIENHPDLKIFLLTFSLSKQQLLWLKTSGVKGCAYKGTKVRDLVDALRRIAAGETYWQNLVLTYSPPLQLTWFSRQCQLGLEQINSNLKAVEKNLKQPKLPLIDYLFWQGRKRELVAASWLVKQVFPEFLMDFSETTYRENNTQIYSIDSQIINQDMTGLTIFDKSSVKISSGIRKTVNLCLEVDILGQEQKKELLLIVLDRIRKTLKNLKEIEITLEEIEERIPFIIQDIWQTATIDFLGKYYLLQQDNQDLAMLNIISGQINYVQEELSLKIPLLKEYFAYLLFEQPLSIDEVVYRFESPESQERGKLLLENLIITVANSIVSLVLNNLNIQEKKIKSICDQDFFSSREIARFRNNLAWRYWREKYWEEPKNIFEDRYSLLVFEGNTINRIYINAIRKEELEELRGSAWLLTIIIEAQDAIAPRLRTVVDWLGRGLVYLLTEIIGRGIGLIGKGILQGIGNSLQKYK